MKLFTDCSMMELYEAGKEFFAENKPLVGESNLVIIEVSDSVRLDIQWEKDGIQVFKVKPEYVLSVGGKIDAN